MNCLPCAACPTVCTTVPDQSLIPNGTWPDGCINTRVTQRCVGTCAPGTYGAPSIMCISTGYDPSTITGRCSSGAGEESKQLLLTSAIE